MAETQQQTATLSNPTATHSDDKTDPPSTDSDAATQELEEDIIVDWDGPDDPGNPKTYVIRSCIRAFRAHEVL